MNTARVALPRAQRGVTLVITLIVLVALMAAGVALIRSVDTATLVAGNLAHKDVSTRAGEIGLQRASEWLQTKVVAGGGLLNQDAIAEGYFSSQHADDPAWNPISSWPSNANIHTLAANALYPDLTISYVIHRLCSLPNVAYNGVVNGVSNRCAIYVPTTGGKGGSLASDASDIGEPPQVFLRVTVRVQGRRGSTSYIQALLLTPG